MLLCYILMCKTLKQALFGSRNVLYILLVLLSDLVVAELKPQRRRQESLLLTILKSVLLPAFASASVRLLRVCAR